MAAFRAAWYNNHPAAQIGHRCCWLQGFGFVVIKRGKYMRAASKGRGFVVARLPSDDGSVCWSAPSWFHTRVSTSGFTTGAQSVSGF